MAEFPIKIVSTHDPTGDKEAVSSLEKVGDSVQDVGKKHVEAAEKAELGHRKVTEILRESTAAVGQHIEALGLLTETSTASFGVVILGAEAVKTALENIEAPAKRADELISNINAERLKSAADNATALAVALGSLADKQNELETAFHRGNTFITDSIKLLGEQLDAQNKIAAAREKAIEMELDLDSRLNPEHKAANDQLKSQLQISLGIQQGKAEETKKQAELNQVQGEFSSARIRILGGNDRNEVAQATNAFDAAKTAAEQAKIRRDSAENTPVQEGPFGSLSAADARNQLEHAREVLERDKTAGNAALVGSDQSAIDQLEKLLARHDAKVAPLQAQYDQAIAAQNTAQSQLDQAKARAEADAKLNAEGAERIRVLTEELNLLRQVNAETASSNARAAGARAATENISEVETAVHGAEQAYHEATTGSQTVAQLHQHILELTQYVRTLAKLNTTNLPPELAAELAQLRSEVAALQQRAPNLGIGQ